MKPELLHRTVLFVTIAAFIVLNPIVHHLAGKRLRGFARSWTMFGGFGRDVCDVRYFERTADGRDLRVDRYEALSWTTTPPDRVRNLSNMESIYAVGQELCPISTTHDVRVFARCVAGHRPWVVVADREQNLCVLGRGS